MDCMPLIELLDQRSIFLRCEGNLLKRNVDSHNPSVTDMDKVIWCYRTWSILVQIMTCHQFGAKPLPKPSADLLSFRPMRTNLRVVFFLIKTQSFSFKKKVLKLLCAKFNNNCFPKSKCYLNVTLKPYLNRPSLISNGIFEHHHLNVDTKMLPYHYRNSHGGDKMILQPSYLHNKNSHRAHFY